MSKTMSSVPGNLFTPEFIDGPYPTYALIRETNPPFKLPGTNDWIAVRYEDCAGVLQHR